MRLARVLTATGWITVGLLGLTGSSSADTITGSITFQSIAINYYDPANGVENFVPPGYSNSSSNVVTVGSYPITFGYEDSFNTDVTTFSSASSFTFQDTVLQATTNFSTQLEFISSTPDFFDGFAIVSDNFPDGGFTESISPDGTTKQKFGRGRREAAFLLVRSAVCGSGRGP
jgi:hypothetical protein